MRKILSPLFMLGAVLISAVACNNLTALPSGAVVATPVPCGSCPTATPDVQSFLTTNKVAFISDRDGHYQLYVMNPDGTNPTRLTFDN